MKLRFPGFKILDRYILGKFLATYFFAIAMIIVVVVLFDYVEKIDDFTELHAPLNEVIFDYYLNFIPFFINQFSGLFTFIACIFFTSKMAYQTEIVAMLSGGMSFRRLMWPYFLGALIIASLSLTLNLWLIPISQRHIVAFEQQYIKRKQNTKYDRHIYRQIEPGIFAYIRGYNDGARQASFFALERYYSGTMTHSLEASDVKFNPETKRWTAPRYTKREFDSLGMETFEQFRNLDTLINLDVAELGEINDLIQTMNISELNAFLDQQRAKGSDSINLIEVEKHARYAYPLSTFILTLIGVSLSSRKVRGGTGLHIGIGTGLCFSYILFNRFFEEFAKSEPSRPGWPCGCPISFTSASPSTFTGRPRNNLRSMEKPQNYLSRLRRHPLLWNLALIAAIILAMAVAAHILMQLGTRHGARRTVPDLSGVQLDQAQRIARKHDLQLHINDSLFVPAYEGGIVLDQLPEGGVEVKPGRTVYITINSFRQKMVPVPYVAGRSLRQAKNMLEIAGLEIAELVYRADMATNYVLEEYCEGKPVTPTTRMEAEMGSGVTLYVGVEEGYGTTIVPRLVGLPLAQAKGRLWELGLNVGRVDFDEGVNLLNQKDTRVYIQTPGAERSAALGSKVDLRLTLDEKKLARYRAEAEKQAAVAAEERRAEEQQRADSLARTVLEEASAEPAEERPANNNEGFFD